MTVLSAPLTMLGGDMFLRLLFVISGFILSLLSDSAFAAGGVVKFIDYYDLILERAGVDHEKLALWAPTAAALFGTIIIFLLGLKYSADIKAAGIDVGPPRRFGVRWFVDAIMEVAYGIGRDTIGHGFEKFLPVLAGLFVFILINNLMGLIPGFPPATESINTNLAAGLTTFIVYNIAGIREHGAHYIKQFLGPVIALAPLMFFIELVSHMARPLSLSLRLMGNLFGDHLMLGVFTGLTYIGFPAVLLFFGLLVAVVQSFVFTLLSSIYISMAVSHDH